MYGNPQPQLINCGGRSATPAADDNQSCLCGCTASAKAWRGAEVDGYIESMYETSSTPKRTGLQRDMRKEPWLSESESTLVAQPSGQWTLSRRDGERDTTEARP